MSCPHTGFLVFQAGSYASPPLGGAIRGWAQGGPCWPGAHLVHLPLCHCRRCGRLLRPLWGPVTAPRVLGHLVLFPGLGGRQRLVILAFQVSHVRQDQPGEEPGVSAGRPGPLPGFLQGSWLPRRHLEERARPDRTQPTWGLPHLAQEASGACARDTLPRVMGRGAPAYPAPPRALPAPGVPQRRPPPRRTSRSGGACTWRRWCCPGCPPARRTRSSRGGGQSPAGTPCEGAADAPWRRGAPGAGPPLTDRSVAAASPALEGGPEGFTWHPSLLPPRGYPAAGPSSCPSTGGQSRWAREGN